MTQETFLDKEVNFKLLMQLRKETKERLNEINNRLHYVLGDEIIKSFKKRGLIFVEEKGGGRDKKRLIAPTFYTLNLKNKKDLPRIFNKKYSVDVLIYKPVNDVTINFVLKSTPANGMESEYWVWKEEDFETFYNRRLKKLFE